MKGRKRHLLVDTEGLVLGVRVLGSNVTDREGGTILLESVHGSFARLHHLFVDGGYKGKWALWVRTALGWTVDVMQRPDPDFHGIWSPNDKPMPDELAEELERKARGTRGFVVIPRRWVVECTYAWLSFCRRLNRDYELLPETTETLVYTAMIRIVTRRLAC